MRTAPLAIGASALATLFVSAGCSSSPVLESRAPSSRFLTSAPAQSNFGPRENDSAATLGGAGSSNQDFDAGAFSITGSWGHFFTDDWEIGVRQTGNFSDFGNSAWNGSTRVSADYHFLDGNFRPMLGANFGWVYGDGVNETLAAAPEVGFKYFIQDGVFIQLLGEYQFFFEDTDDAADAFDSGQWVYSLGFGILFR